MQAVGVVQTAGAKGVAGAQDSLLSMYNEQPSEELTLQDFEVLALDRLKGKQLPRCCCAAFRMLLGAAQCSKASQVV